MQTRTHIALALTLTALGLAPGAAHLMELPVKLGYPAAFYAEVTSTLYAWYGVAGGAVLVAAALAVAVLAMRLRGEPEFGLAMAAAVSLLVSLALWGFVVSPVSAAWAELSRADPAAWAAGYERLRVRWEFGHVAAFIAWLTGWFGVLAVSVRRPGSRPRDGWNTPAA
jgi:hypothetical protein